MRSDEAIRISQQAQADKNGVAACTATGFYGELFGCLAHFLVLAYAFGRGSENGKRLLQMLKIGKRKSLFRIAK